MPYNNARFTDCKAFRYDWCNLATVHHDEDPLAGVRERRNRDPSMGTGRSVNLTTLEDTGPGLWDRTTRGRSVGLLSRTQWHHTHHTLMEPVRNSVIHKHGLVIGAASGRAV
jgi:hypothetical protein